MENVSVVTLFTLSGLNYTLEIRITLFVLTLLWYLMVLIGNFALIIAVVMDKSLHEPMYIFLCNLCINALYGTVGFYPKFLWDLLSSHVITHAGCLLQGFVIHSSLCGDFSILALMAYDRYVAICRPLVYHSVMTKERICIFVFVSWLIPFYGMFMNTSSLLASQLCGSQINRIYCINWMIAKLTCSKTTVNGILVFITIIIYILHGLFIMWSYIYIIKTCINSVEKRGKFMQTCVPHLTSLLTFLATMMVDVLLVQFGSKDTPQTIQNFVTIEYLLIPPILNPLIYGFKLTKIRNRILGFVKSTHKS
ncbi:hypothetical protein LDENG_00034260 [Lucifuga dentata]|nr:hypothetical protein LDENG_00034260 [Lucifuga dentata]